MSLSRTVQKSTTTDSSIILTWLPLRAGDDQHRRLRPRGVHLDLQVHRDEAVPRRGCGLRGGVCQPGRLETTLFATSTTTDSRFVRHPLNSTLVDADGYLRRSRAPPDLRIKSRTCVCVLAPSLQASDSCVLLQHIPEEYEYSSTPNACYVSNAGGAHIVPGCDVRLRILGVRFDSLVSPVLLCCCCCLVQRCVLGHIQ
jgi:hypothetical protein